MCSLSSMSEDECIHYLSQLLKEKKRVMIFLRGLPGSGKSFLARRINSRLGGYIASADNYFIRSGEYRYDRDHLEYAHCDCQNKVKDKAREQVSPIIVDNTNLEAWEMKPYVKTAIEFGYTVQLVEPPTEWRYNPRVCHRYNRHDIPLEKIARMKDKFDRNVTAEKLIKQCQNQYNILSPSHFELYLNSSQPHESNGMITSDSRYIKSKSPIESNGSAPSIRSAIRSFSNATEWKIPFYPSSDTDSVYSTANSSSSTTVCDSSCQTATQMPNSSRSFHTNDFGEMGLYTRGAIVRKVTSADKSTSSWTNPNSIHCVTSREEQLQILADKFPEVEQETLMDIIEVCNGNIHYAINVLSDASCDSSNSEESIPMMDDLSPHHIPNSIFDQVDRVETTNDAQFTLELPASFASELEGEFGSLPSHTAYFNRSLSIPRHLAKQLYDIWRYQCQSSQDDRVANTIKPPAGEFEEQMQLEEALKQSRATADAPANPDLIQLYQKYPGCSEEILDAIYFDNDRDLERTIAAVDEQTRLASSSTVDADAKWSKVAKKAPTHTFENDDCGTGDYYILDESEFTDLRNRLLDRKKTLLEQRTNQKDPKTAQYYSEEINKMEREEQKLLNAFVVFRQKSFSDSNTLDLHGSRIKEGAQLLQAFILKKQEEITSKGIPHVDLEIVTGWGLHSPRMRGTLFGAMIQVARQLGFTVKNKNKGCFSIRVYRTS